MSPTATARRRSRSKEVTSIRRIDQDATAWAGLDEDLDLERLVFDWVSDTVRDLDVRGAITAITIERTIEGASTLTVNLRDPENRLFAGSRMWEPLTKKDKKRKQTRRLDFHGGKLKTPTKRGRQMEVRLDGIVFRLAKVSKNGDETSLTFEDRVIYWLRKRKSEKRAKRAKVTRAQFILALLREIKQQQVVRFVCPELNVAQPIDRPEASTGKRKTKGKRKASGRDISKDASGLTVQGRAATSEQKRLGARALAVAADLEASDKAQLALIEACIIESGIRNLNYGHADSLGILQVRVSTSGSSTRSRDVEWCVRRFLLTGFWGRGGAIQLAKRNPRQSAGWVAQQCQGSAFPERYDKVREEALQWVKAYGAGGIAESDAAGGRTRYKSYQFTREKDEDSWTAMQRLATEVGWRCFMQGRSMFYMSEQDLFRRKPQYVFKPEDPAVQDLSYDVDWGKRVSSARITITAGNWKCPPGEPVLVQGFGPPDGRWLCVGWSRDYFQPLVEVELRQPAREGMEPAAEQVSGDSSSSGGLGLSATGLDESSAVMRAYRRADAIDKKRQAYVWGGGHGSFNDARGYDCSGFVSSCLHAGGMLSTPQATPGLIGWGNAGKGKYLTVWVKETGVASQSHTFMTFNIKGRVRYAEAGGAESGKTGWHRPRSHAGFQPRHWPNT